MISPDNKEIRTSYNFAVIKQLEIVKNKCLSADKQIGLCNFINGFTNLPCFQINQNQHTYPRKVHDTLPGNTFALMLFICGCLKTLHATPLATAIAAALATATLAIYVLHLLHIRHVGRVQQLRQIDGCCRCSSHFFCGTKNRKGKIY